MNLADVRRIRLDTQFLTTPGPAPASEIVRALGAVQSQDYSGAKWALSQRAGFLPDVAIEQEFTDGKILRTHVLRPTWHFVTPEDIRWLLRLTAPRVGAMMSSYNRKLELTPDVFRKTNDAVAGALAGGRFLMRSELRAILERLRIGAISGQRLGHIMMQAELDAVVCSGPRRGLQFTYALLDERAPGTPEKDRDEALADLTLLYFRTRGPATVNDCAWWSGLRTADVRRGIDIVGKQLESAELGAHTVWFRPGARDMKRKASAHLLPNYDEYFIGHRDRSAIAGRLGSAKLVTGASALMGHIAFIDGQLIGGWKRTVTPQHVRIDVQALTRLSPPEKKRIESAATKFGKFLGAATRIGWPRT